MQTNKLGPNFSVETTLSSYELKQNYQHLIIESISSGEWSVQYRHTQFICNWNVEIISVYYLSRQGVENKWLNWN